ncbi:MAG: AbrB/MazE/SpoVT family DNA-binding domain-containing protein [Candidatus Gracilibacteria bacterium]|nr:AbrB/MazE/SpoVT family DNA-binding domain-containing protein [Candidatus Gracilibacteria bacterium]
MAQENNPMNDQDDSCMGVKMYGSVVVGTKGQIVIPSEVRRTLHINPGDSMCVLTKHGKAIALIKMDDMSVFMEYMQEEINYFKSTLNSPSTTKSE